MKIQINSIELNMKKILKILNIFTKIMEIKWIQLKIMKELFELYPMTQSKSLTSILLPVQKGSNIDFKILSCIPRSQSIAVERLSKSVEIFYADREISASNGFTGKSFQIFRFKGLVCLSNSNIRIMIFKTVNIQRWSLSNVIVLSKVICFQSDPNIRHYHLRPTSKLYFHIISLLIVGPTQSGQYACLQ